MSTLSVAEENEALLTINQKSQTPLHKNQYITTLVVLLAPILMGYTLGYSSPALPDLVDNKILTSDGQQAWFGSMVAIGAIFGGPIAGMSINKLGRKYSVMICAFPYAVGYAMIASVNSVAALYVGRILTGVGAGMTSLATPVYIAEVSSPDIRGALGASFQLSVTIGVFIVNVFGVPLSYVWLANVGCLVCALLVVLMLIMPETPQYYIMQHQRDRALSVLVWLRGPNYNSDRECREIEDNTNLKKNDFQYKEFFNAYLYIPLTISLCLMVFQQFSGINAVIFYGVTIFQSAAPSIEEHVASIIITAVQVLATLVAVILMDRAGRRILLILAGIGMCISSTTFGVYYDLTKNSTSSANVSLTNTDLGDSHTPDLTWLSMMSMIIYITAFSLGWGAIPWLIMSEIFPTRARGAASSIATAVNWTCAFIVTKEFFDMESAMTSAGVFWFYGGVCLVGVIFVVVCVPETKGKTLEEISEYFSRDQKILDFPIAEQIT
ncbi:solute carrier family 2, facilitated glucose transporter member 8-like [Antedon mediterranea]|uniref:solute carrier family 2, facilitated glucose transporter member 8-like n=1 Tax=Antedon mediterranea TaxID=105859 RepID=UPI003AF4BE5A